MRSLALSLALLAVLVVLDIPPHARLFALVSDRLPVVRGTHGVASGGYAVPPIPRRMQLHSQGRRQSRRESCLPPKAVAAGPRCRRMNRVYPLGIHRQWHDHARVVAASQDDGRLCVNGFDLDLWLCLAVDAAKPLLHE